MHRAIIASISFSMLLVAGYMPIGACLADSPSDPPQNCEADTVRTVLDKLAERAGGLESYQCKVDYLFKQVLLESQSRRKGVLYYAKFDNRSYLRIDFDTLQQNEEKERKSREQFFFDGVWLTYVDHELKSVEQHQMAEPNNPVDAFTLVSRRVPVVGFSQIHDLEKQFEIELVEQAPSEASAFHQLHLKAKPDSMYKDDYSTINFWIDKKQGLPAKIVAVDAEQDIHEIRLTDARINSGIRRNVFNVDIPADFSVERVPLRRGQTGR